jgi:hypothetical protein
MLKGDIFTLWMPLDWQCSMTVRYEGRMALMKPQGLNLKALMELSILYQDFLLMMV